MGFMEISIPTMIFLVINFLLLVAILWYALYRPVGNLLRAREQRIQNDLDSAKRERAEAEKLRKEYEQKLLQLKRDVHDALERAHWQGEQERQELIAKAREEASAIIERATRQIENERKRAWDELKNDVAEIAILAASRALGRIIDSEYQRRIFNEFVEGIRLEKTGERHDTQ